MKLFRSILSLILLGAVLLPATPAAAAGMITVETETDGITANGLCSLREAIHNANNDAATFPDCAAGSGADTITFAADYTITLADQLPTITGELTINGQGADKTIIRANASPGVAGYRVFEVGYYANLTLGQVSVQNGGGEEGGGIYTRFAAKLTVTDSSLSGNSATAGGGGIYAASGSTLNVENSTFSANTAAHGGGGAINAHIDCVLTVTNSTFAANTAYSGGGISSTYCKLTVTNSSFLNNSAAVSGGGIWNDHTSSLTVTNSTFLNNSAAVSGGGIWNDDNSSLTLTNSTLSGNTTEDGGWGGGLYLGSSRGTSTVTNSTFSSNQATNGGGISNHRTLTVTDSIFNNNTADSGGGIRTTGSFSNTYVTGSVFSGNQANTGGGIHVEFEGELSVANSSFSENAATEGGGGIYAADHITLNVENSTFRSNSAATTGGGISTDVGGTLTVTGSSLSANMAANGGGIYFRRSEDAFVMSSTFNSNSATAEGGGIRGVESGRGKITNSTFSANTANTGGGLSLIQSGVAVRNSTFYENSATTGGGIQIANTSLTLNNTIVANSPNGGNCTNGIINGGNNLDSAATCKWASQNGSMSNTNPKLGPLANNGGPTQTHALLQGSPAIDKGKATVCSQAPVSGVDQRGVVRPQGAGCDIGAYEYNAAVLPEAPTFGDVAKAYWAWEFVERLYAAGITGGCSTSPLSYCPESTVTRAQMAIFLLRGIHGSNYNPPAVGTGTGFGDVPPTYWAASWIKQLAAEGITGGCGVGTYCPEGAVTRAQMAIFLLRSKHGSNYTPPAVGSSTGFTDVPSTYWAAAWIKQLVAEGITTGCGASTYCPEAPVTRAQMAVFLVRTFSLP